ncbi:MAG TPA: hypothetical protein VIL92_01630 [Gaiellaceae bacterium]
MDVRVRDQAVTRPVDLHAQTAVHEDPTVEERVEHLEPRSADGAREVGGCQFVAEDALLDVPGLRRDVALGLPHLLVLDVPEQGTPGRRDDGSSCSGEPQVQAS